MSLLAHRGLLLGSAPATDPFYASVASLLHFDGSDGSTTILDQKGLTWSCAAGCELDTAQAKWGPSSLLCVTTGNNLSTASTAMLVGTNDYTIEMWIRPTGVASFQELFSNRPSGAGNGGQTFRITNTSRLQWFKGAGGSSVTTSTNLTAGVWQHVAVTRVGTTMRIFLNGVLDGSLGGVTGSNDATPNATTYVGSYGASNVERFGGHIDDFRFTNGVGRYTANFTPPTGPFPNS